MIVSKHSSEYRDKKFQGGTGIGKSEMSRAGKSNFVLQSLSIADTLHV